MNIEVSFAPSGQILRKIVDGVCLHVRRHTTTALVGESGSGKSQFLHAILGFTRCFPGLTGGTAFLQPTPGHVIQLVGSLPTEQTVRFLADYRVLSRHMTVMFQGVDSHLNPYEPVARQLLRKAPLLPGSPVTEAGGPEAFVQANLAPFFQSAKERARIARSFPCELSGGQRARVGLCLALTSPAGVLVTDEPTTGLDPGLRRDVYLMLRHEVEERRRTLLIISHDVDLVAKFAQDLHIMRSGRLVESVCDGDATGLRDQYSQTLFSPLAVIALQGSMDQVEANLAAVERASASMENAEPDIVLRADRVCKSFLIPGGGNHGGDRVVEAVKDASITIRRGEAVAIVGESGSGKSTLARMLAGLLPPDSGQVVFQSAAVDGAVLPSEPSYRQYVQMLHQNPDTMLHPRVDVRGLCRDSMQLWRERCKYCDTSEFLDFAQLAAERANQYPDSLSGGEKRRLGLARVLAGQPELVLADEIASGLDRVLQARILARLGRLRAAGLTLVIINHDLDLARYLCDTVIVMKEGRIVDRCRASELDLRARAHHPYTEYLLRAESLEPDSATAPATPQSGSPVATPTSSDGRRSP